MHNASEQKYTYTIYVYTALRRTRMQLCNWYIRSECSNAGKPQVAAKHEQPSFFSYIKRDMCTMNAL